MAAESKTASAHLKHSHAREGDIPGTVNLQVVEGDDTAYGQALFPVPAEDPNDPLQWGRFKKIAILVICSLYSFLGNSALLGPAVYIINYSMEFNISPNTASGLISYPNLAFGFGSLILVPLYHKFGRRPIMLGSMVFYCIGLIGASQATTYEALMAWRVVHGFGSGVCEALPVQLVNDIFFLHERGKMLGYYTVALCLGSTGPLYAGYMLNGGYSWRLFFYVEFAFAMALLIAAFLLVEETNYHRVKPSDLSDNPDEAVVKTVETQTTSHVIPPRRSYVQTLKFWGVHNRESEFFMMIFRSFSYYLVPPVLWVVTTYGLNIGLGAFTFNYIFPLKITAPPYNWTQLNSGLLAVCSLIGYPLAVPFAPISDRLAARLTRRNNGIREAEMRLGALLPVALFGPIALIVFGYAAERDLPWISYFVAVTISQFAGYFWFTFTLAYAIDSYQSNISEMLIAMNLGKQAISFGMSVNILEWVLQNGYVNMIAGVFGGILMANNLFLVVFMIWGKRIRKFMAGTSLARAHKKSIRGEVATH